MECLTKIHSDPGTRRQNSEVNIKAGNPENSWYLVICHRSLFPDWFAKADPVENVGAKQVALTYILLLHNSIDCLYVPRHQSFSFLLDTTKTSTAFERRIKGEAPTH